MPLFVPITGGSPSGDVAVVALAQGDALICTGTVIAPHAVLTAGHCVADARLPDIAIGDTLATAVRHAAVAAFVHPGFDGQTLEHDIAVLIVDPPLEVPPIAIATTLELAAGSAMRIVGYGYTVAGDTSPPARHTGTSLVDTVDALKLVSHGAPEQTCEGDSGGPALFDGGGGEHIVGVASSGDSGCTMFARHTRVDVHADFVLDAVARTAAGAARAGERCWYDGNCNAGSCLPAPDEPRLSFCAPLCATGKCPGDLQCKTIDGEPRCVHRAPSPGAEGARCTSDTDCAGALCLAADGSSQRVCTTRCFSDLPGFACPGDETCRLAADGREACFAPPTDDGCTATRGSGWAFALVSLVFAARVLRRRS